ncbi:TetR/AcrR family transcriptional regulator [Aestuariicella sp. G3-2]|uniref:TetR/AcrR family transcriptional regulator n=1 Tax=Pseudomaricurvus albidus TaxID=2842452 RepID=UPI001C0AD1B7|nr:TetR/AcrR family transcriptional regulator [Aestuariicella albida]MBU3069196.1 TetR/AcrR family transcriptional regulator [Aestuariicella albida]
MAEASNSLKHRILYGIDSTKSDSKAAIKKARILGAARAILHEKGHDAFSLRAVAKASGFSPSGLYEHFKNKEAIRTALADDAWNNLGKHLNRATQNVDDPIERLVVGCEAYIDYAAKNREDFLLIFSVLPSPRSSHESSIPEGSGLAVFLRNVKAAAEAKLICANSEQEQINVVYGLWSTAHGMAHLHAVHLADFKANFAESNRSVFIALIRGYAG